MLIKGYLLYSSGSRRPDCITALSLLQLLFAAWSVSVVRRLVTIHCSNIPFIQRKDSSMDARIKKLKGREGIEQENRSFFFVLFDGARVSNPSYS